ncbi:S9 family peptidase [Halobacteriales archaeon QS_3_64_16]|nr:MAG: S9 family peptidase [Halobacteriales archaeon QS_3_64_16]
MPEPGNDGDLLPIERFYDLTLVSELSLSPDGERVAFVVEESEREADERRQSVCVVPADGSRSPHRLSRASDAGSPKWSPDGTRLGVLAARERDSELAVTDTDDDSEGDDAAAESEDTGDGSEADDEPKSQVWVFDLEVGGDARQVTDREEGVNEFDWGPESERIVVSARDPTDEEREHLEARREGEAPIETERLQHKFDGAGWLDTVTTYLFVIDVETRDKRRLDDAYGSGAYESITGLQPTWVSETEIAFLSNPLENPDDSAVMDLYLADAESGAVERITDGDLTVGTIEAAPAESETRLAFGADEPENWCIPTQVYAWDGESYESLTADLDRTLTRNASLCWIDDESLLTTIADEAHTRPCRVDTNGEVERVGGAIVDDASIAAVDAQGGTVALALSHPSEGLDVHTIGLDALDGSGDGETSSGKRGGKRDLQRVTALNDDLLEEEVMPECRRVSYESDGHEIDAIAYLPPEFDPSDPETHPLVVSIHGGPISYDSPEFSFEYGVLASRGYVVLCPNYRGGTSYGRAFAEELYGQWGSVEVEDIVRGIKHLVERGWADPDRVFGRGFSYGGIAQGYLVTQTDVLTAAAPEHGIYDLRSAFGTDDSHVRMEAEFGLPWEDEEGFRTSSSITQAGNIDTPLLVTAGGEDWRCPPSQSEQLYIAARKQGVEAKLLVYPDEHHNVGDPDRAIHRLKQLTAWYERHDPARGTEEE